MTKNIVFTKKLVAAGLALAGTALQAQNVELTDSRATTYDPTGIGAGGFRIYPSVQARLTYDDNIFLRDNNVVGDSLVTITPSVRAQSDWTSHSLAMTASSTVRRYFSNQDQNSEEYRAIADGRLDILKSWNVGATADYGHLIEPRGTAGNDFVTGEPVRYDRYSGALRTAKSFNRIAFSGGVSADRYRYQDVRSGGIFVDQSLRDHDTLVARLRVDNRIGGSSSLFVSTSINKINYRNLKTRDSKGYAALAGIRFEVTRLLHGEAGLGYIHQSFDDPRFRGFSGLNYSANLIYEPTRLTTFRLKASRQIADSAIAGVPGVLQSRVRFEVEHELLRRLILTGYVEGNREIYRGIDRRERRYYAGAGARYYLNRNFAATLSYDRQQQNGRGPFNNDYRGNRISVSLLAQR
jgi:hypothetical protein